MKLPSISICDPKFKEHSGIREPSDLVTILNLGSSMSSRRQKYDSCKAICQRIIIRGERVIAVAFIIDHNLKVHMPKK